MLALCTASLHWKRRFPFFSSSHSINCLFPLFFSGYCCLFKRLHKFKTNFYSCAEYEKFAFLECLPPPSRTEATYWMICNMCRLKCAQWMWERREKKTCAPSNIPHRLECIRSKNSLHVSLRIERKKLAQNGAGAATGTGIHSISSATNMAIELNYLLLYGWRAGLL